MGEIGMKTITIFGCIIILICSAGCQSRQLDTTLDIERSSGVVQSQGQRVSNVYAVEPCFITQTTYFFNYHGRVPEDYDEWKSSGFLALVLYNKEEKRPGRHVDSIEEGGLFDFHYEFARGKWLLNYF